ncbi:hypothetical protein TNCV_1789911 [Trichonephila clavipes]|nr:hypothetical protein TNCV_1789911 [Trichonephila clavipes]
MYQPQQCTKKPHLAMNVHVSLPSTDIPHSSTDILKHFVMLFASKAVSFMASLAVGVAAQPRDSFTKSKCSFCHTRPVQLST